MSVDGKCERGGRSGSGGRSGRGELLVIDEDIIERRGVQEVWRAGDALKVCRQDDVGVCRAECTCDYCIEHTPGVYHTH